MSRRNGCYPIALVYGVGVGPCKSPGFGQGCQNTPWFVLMLPFIEQGPLYNSFNASIGMEGPPLGSAPLGGFIVNSTVFTTKIASFQCPSDNQQHLQLRDLERGDRGRCSGVRLLADQGELRHQCGQYGLRRGRLREHTPPCIARPRSAATRAGRARLAIRVASVTDGMSNTQFISEILQGANDDTRGTVWFDDPGAGSYMTRFTPNGFLDFLGSGVNMDVVASVRHGPGPQPAATRRAVRQPARAELACFNSSSEGAAFGGSRSRHPGGVNTLFGDGSVHFMKNSINPQTWVALGTISGGEVISSDSY